MEKSLRVRLRVWRRVVLLVFWTGGLLALRIVSRATTVVSRRLALSLRWHIFRLWAKGALVIAGARVHVSGTPPKPPFFCVANHLSHVDILLMAASTGCIFIARHDMADWPIVGFLTKALDCLLINRERREETVRVNRHIVEAIEKGYGVQVFAEGGISETGEFQALKSSLLEAPARLHCPVHYAAISYKTLPGCPPAKEDILWGSDKTYGEHAMRLLGLPGFEALLTFGEAPIVAENRKELARRLHQAIADRIVPPDSF